MLSSDTVDKCEYLRGKEHLCSNQIQIKEQVKYTFSPLRKVFERQTNKIEDEGRSK